MLAQRISETMTIIPDATTDRFVEIANKLGTFRFDRDLSIEFPHGMIGFPDAIDFGLADLPDAMQQFKLLQCLNIPSLSFVVLPMELSQTPVDAEDVKDAAEVLGIAPDDLAMLFVITIRSMGPGQGITMSVNHAAPIMVDTRRRLARQFVFSNNKYQVQHQLG